ncbi:MAG: FAD-dependent oxidoreductase [Roseiflexaceae bacterium]|nr:FAD-dependent oxidoreductase [Roseiflexaceae bacterium]
MLLALLLARQGVRVTLLEAQASFERDFRGNTLSPAALELLDELGLTDQVLALRHAKIPRFDVATAEGVVTFADFTQLPSRYPYIVMVPQSAFLQLLNEQLAMQRNAHLIMQAKVRELIVEQGVVRGVRYALGEERRELRAQLTIGADGRFSTVRKLAGIALKPSNAPIDVLWFRLPRRPCDQDEAEALFRFGHGALLALMDHGETWQIGYIVQKGGYGELRERGFPAFQDAVAEILPGLAERVRALRGWADCALLPVESSRAVRWHRPGLLLIGDAAHVMSPVGGVGITCALQDASVAATLLAAPLLAGALREANLRQVQRRREWPTRVVQAAQHFAHRQVIDGALASVGPFRMPAYLRFALRVPLLKQVPARLIGLGRVL